MQLTSYQKNNNNINYDYIIVSSWNRNIKKESELFTEPNLFEKYLPFDIDKEKIELCNVIKIIFYSKNIAKYLTWSSK